MKKLKATKADAPMAISEVQPGFIKKKDLAARLLVTARTVENWQRRGVLPFVKVGKVVLFDWLEVVATLKKNFGVHRATISK